MLKSSRKFQFGLNNLFVSRKPEDVFTKEIKSFTLYRFHGYDVRDSVLENYNRRMYSLVTEIFLMTCNQHKVKGGGIIVSLTQRLI